MKLGDKGFLRVPNTNLGLNSKWPIQYGDSRFKKNQYINGFS